MLATGTLMLLAVAALAVYMLSTGDVFGTVFMSALFLMGVWNTYDTFVIHQCWTLYLKVVE